MSDVSNTTSRLFHWFQVIDAAPHAFGRIRDDIYDPLAPVCRDIHRP